MGTLKIERVGGFAGYGLSLSRLRSTGETSFSALSAPDQAAVEALFSTPARPDRAGAVRDGFRYRITRSVDGRDQTVEVPEAAVPAALKDCVADRLL